MALAFVDRPPTEEEFERFRLILSTYQDGSGMLARTGGRTLPGWRDFERSVAVAFGGDSQENKFIFDVLVSDNEKQVKYGISCKMRSELNRVDRDGRVTIELSNSSKKFLDYLSSKGIYRSDYMQRASEVGKALVELVEAWKLAASLESGGHIDLSKSCYLTLMYNKAGQYQVHWFTVALPDPTDITWYYPNINREGRHTAAGHLNGDDSSGGRLFEWYGDSGGQLKYYPLATSAKWASSRFELEPISEEVKKLGLLSKAKMYFPAQWAASEKTAEERE